MENQYQRLINKILRTGVLLGALFILSIFCQTLLVMPRDAASQEDTSVFKDLNAEMPLYRSVIYLYCKGIVNGFPDLTYRADESLTRAQAAALVTAAAKIAPVKNGQPSFSDVSPDHWAYGAIEAAVRAGLLSGYPDGTFHPESSITRAEAVTLLLKLSGRPLDGKDVAIGDMGSGHWAYRQVSNAVDAGLVELPANRLFQPGLDLRRGEMARGLSSMITLSPKLRRAELIGKLTVKKGKVTVGAGSGAREAAGETLVGAGAVITTGSDSQAEIIFDDGSGILIDAETMIIITGSKGFNYMRQDGTPGVAVDKLNIKLDHGRIFGSLASSLYKGTEKIRGAVKTSRAQWPSKYPLLLASAQTPTWLGEILLAEGETYSEEYTGENTEVNWWEEPYTERERVVVDMPWGTAGVRGTFWMCQAYGGNENIVSVATGTVVVRAGGSTITVDAGRYMEIPYAGAVPSAPAAMTLNLQQQWANMDSWVRERLDDINNDLPLPYAPVVLPPEVPVEQPPVLLGFNQAEVNYINDANIFSQITENVTAAPPAAPPAAPGGGGGGSGGDAYDAVPPAVVNSPDNISAAASIVIVFSENIKPGFSFNSITLIDAGGNPVDVQCATSGNELIIEPLGVLAPGASYTVVIPAGTVQDMSGIHLDSDYSFSFSTEALSSGSSVELKVRINIVS